MLTDNDHVSQPYLARRAHWNAHLERHAAMQPDRPAMRFRGTTTTWQQLHERVAALAGVLARRGVTFGDRVAILTGNRPEFVESVLAANLLGAMAVPLNFRLTGPEAAYVLQDSAAKVVIVDELGKPIVEAALSRPDDTLSVIVVGTQPTPHLDYEALLAEEGPVPEPVDIPEQTPALIMYTSGTTGKPKGAVLTHVNLQAQAMTVVRTFEYVDQDETTLIASPLFHIGAIGSVIPTILVGGVLVIVPTGAFDPGEVLHVLDQERVTNVFLVPTQWQAVCDHPTAATRELPQLRVLGWGAAPATDTLLEKMSATFPHAMNVALFGQTEMSPVTCVLHGRDAIRKLGSVGKPIATVTMRVVDPQMNDVPPGDVGEIVYRGSSLMLGYWNRPEETREALRGGWFHSGDLVRVDDEGYVYVVDRAKDMIISGGENIYCAEVENVLAAHPNIAEVSVVGRPHERWGETPIAVVVLRDSDSPLDITDLRAWAAQSLAKYKLPTQLDLVTALPRNPSGKVLKSVLRTKVSV